MPTTTQKQAADEQAKTIAAARRLLKPEKVTLGKIPSWLIRRVKTYAQQHEIIFNGCRDDSLHSVMLHVAEQAGLDIHSAGLLDHWGVAKGGRYHCCHKSEGNFVSEVYDFSTTDALFWDAFCKALDLTWHITANSWWYPSHTLRVTVHEKHPWIPA
jgi:hypothetical protein